MIQNLLIRTYVRTYLLDGICRYVRRYWLIFCWLIHFPTYVQIYVYGCEETKKLLMRNLNINIIFVTSWHKKKNQAYCKKNLSWSFIELIAIPNVRPLYSDRISTECGILALRGRTYTISRILNLVFNILRSHFGLAKYIEYEIPNLLEVVLSVRTYKLSTPS